jgi:hypothetical protein
MRNAILALGVGLLIAGCATVQPEGQPKNPNASENASVAARLGIPPGQLPPAGQCKVWMPGEPPGKQKKKYSAGDCDVVRRQVPEGGWLVYRPGEDKKEVVVREYGASFVVNWEAVYDVVTGVLLREEDRGR